MQTTINKLQFSHMQSLHSTLANKRPKDDISCPYFAGFVVYEKLHVFFKRAWCNEITLANEEMKYLDCYLQGTTECLLP